MKLSALLVCAAALLAAPASLSAAPVVTMRYNFVGGFWSLDTPVFDFYYTASPGAEFTNYRLTVQSSNGTKILDPIPSATDDQDGDAADTWANTVYSLHGLGPASYTFNSYRPTGINKNSPPTSLLDWSVFDTGNGDTNSFDLGPPYGVVSAPWHIARVAVSPDFFGTVSFLAFDSQSNGIGTPFSFYGGPQQYSDPPAVSHSTIVAIPGDSLDYLFKAISFYSQIPTWSDFTFSGPAAGSQPLFDYSTHQFNWDTLGSASGEYTASVLVTNTNGKSDRATLTINLIPEPATGMLTLSGTLVLSGHRRRKGAFPTA